VLLKPGVTVNEIAKTLKIDPALTSKYLRDLNARGLLSAARRAANVYYRVKANPSVPQASSLISALVETFRADERASDVIFRKATAFTQPRRVAIVHELAQRPARFIELHRRLGISKTALKRHLRKLDARGFLRCTERRGVYAVINAGTPLEMALLKLAEKT